MAKIEVTINGKVYPCRPTMGAMLRFKKETGKEVTEITSNSFSDLCAYLYCCVASASAADKVPFEMSLMDFADALNPEDMTAWANAVQGAAAPAEDAEKKKLEPKGIYELLGIALGCIRLSYDDFCNMDFQEFAAVYKAYAEQRDFDYKNSWERMRLLAAITIQPHLAKGKKITPEKLLPFPWDKKKVAAAKKAKEITPEQQRRRMEELVKKLGDSL